MKTRNRLLAVLLTLVMLVGILPVSAFAESVVPAAGMDIAIWLGDTQVTDQNKDDILSDGGKAKYDPSAMTLTLNDPEISTVSPNGAVIEVNELDLTITGSATLNVSGADYGIGVWDGVLNINGNINATGVIGGIFVPRSDLNIDGGTVTAAATGTNVMGAVYTEGTLSISGGTVTAKAVNPGLNHGVYAGSGLILSGGSLDARGYYRGIGTMGAIDIGNDIDGLVAMGNNCGIAAGPAEISIGDLLNIVQPADGQLSSDKHTIVSAANPEVAAQIVEITPTSYTVRFMDGSTELDTQTVRHGAFATPPSPSPEKIGCIFFGWYTDESFTDSFDFGQSITADTDIYALFVSEYTVTLDMNGGKILDAEDAWQDSVSMEFYEGYEQEIPSVEWMNEMVADGNWIIGPANSEYIGAEITDANGVKNYQPGEMYTVVSDATIKVLWNSNSSTPSVISEIHINGFEEPIVGEKAGNYLNLNVPDDCHYTIVQKQWWNNFNHCFMDADDEFEYGKSYACNVQVEADDGWVFDSLYMKYYANGTEDIVNYMYSYVQSGNSFAWLETLPMMMPSIVTFMDGETVLEELTQTVDADQNPTRPNPDPTKDGYIFENWYADPGLSVEYNFDNPIGTNTTIYAKFNRLYNVTVKGDGKVYSDYDRTKEITQAAEGDLLYLDYAEPDKETYVTGVKFDGSDMTPYFYWNGVTMPNHDVEFEIATAQRQTYTVDIRSGYVQIPKEVYALNVSWRAKSYSIFQDTRHWDINNSGKYDITTEYVIGGGGLPDYADAVKHADCDIEGVYTVDVPYMDTPYSKVIFLFSDRTYNVDITTDPEEGGDVFGDASYLAGTEATVRVETNEGYIFAGWYENGSLISTAETYKFTITCDHYFVAKFIKIWTVTLDMNGGQIKDAEDAWQETLSMEFYEGYEQEIPSVEWMNEMVADGTWITAPADSEYIGVEITDAAGTKTYQPGEVYTVASDVIIKLLWKSTKTYTVTVAADPKDGGTVTGGGTVLEGESVTVKASANPGYEFIGWYDGDDPVSWEEEYTVDSVTGDMTLTAKFIKTWKVTLDMNGGQIKDAEDEWQSTLSMEFYEGYEQEIPSVEWMNEMVADGTWITAPADSEYIGVEITDATGTKTYQPGEVYALTSDATLKVLWKSSIPAPTTAAISFDLNGGTLDGKTGIVTIIVKNGTSITLPAPTREGYTFDYWEGSRYNAGDLYTVNGDHTFTAQWKKNSDDPGISDPDMPPKTGDESNPVLWGSLMFLSVAAMVSLFLCMRKRKTEES